VSTGEAPAGLLPETAAVYWRPRIDDARLRRRARMWTATTMAHSVTLVGMAALLLVLSLYTLPVALIALVKAWIIPELYAARGANVLRPPRAPRVDADVRWDEDGAAQRRALGLLGDLVGHDARELHAGTGLVLERGRLGVWLVAQAGAVLIRPGARRVHCFCVRVNDPELPPADRTAHLLLALRADEQGFATVGNEAFSGARWRLARRAPKSVRPALAAAARTAAFDQA
jgi:hypothetical protein